MPTSLPATTDFTGATVTQGGFKTAHDNLVTAYNNRLSGVEPITVGAGSTIGAAALPNSSSIDANGNVIHNGSSGHVFKIGGSAVFGNVWLTTNGGGSLTTLGSTASSWGFGGEDVLALGAYTSFLGRNSLPVTYIYTGCYTDTVGAVRYSAASGAATSAFGYGGLGITFYPAGAVGASLGSSTGSVNFDTTGKISATGSYAATTASAANLNIDSSGNITRSTSVGAAKTDVETMTPDYADKIVSGLRPVYYRSTLAGDDPAWGWYSFIAEEAAAVEPRCATWHPEFKGLQNSEVVTQTQESRPVVDGDGAPVLNADGTAKTEVATVVHREIVATPVLGAAIPDGINDRAIIAALVNRDQRHEARIAALEGFIKTMTAQIAALTPKT